MAQFTTTNLASNNLPPDAVGDNSATIEYGNEVIFTYDSFTTETIPAYSDPEGDAPSKLKITLLPLDGQLTLSGTIVSLNQEIPFTDITAQNLKFIPNPLSVTAYTTSFQYSISDVGSESFTGTGRFTIDVAAKENEPPTIGDGADSIAYGSTKTFTVADLTTNTVPPYSDPEGDAANELMILELPARGELLFKGLPMVVNQVITFSDIAAGFFTQKGDPSDTSEYDVTFRFSISDVGSGIFVE